MLFDLLLILFYGAPKGGNKALGVCSNAIFGVTSVSVKHKGQMNGINDI